MHELSSVFSHVTLLWAFAAYVVYEAEAWAG